MKEAFTVMPARTGPSPLCSQAHLDRVHRSRHDRGGVDENGTGLIIGFMAELSQELATTRAELAIFAAAAAKPVPAFSPRLSPFSPMLRCGHAATKELATKTARPTLNRLANAF
jgi:hypothetical protein